MFAWKGGVSLSVEVAPKPCDKPPLAGAHWNGPWASLELTTARKGSVMSLASHSAARRCWRKVAYSPPNGFCSVPTVSRIPFSIQ